MAQGGGKVGGGVVEALASGRKQVFGARQAGTGGAVAVAGVLRDAAGGVTLAAAEFVDIADEFGTDGDGGLGGGGRGRGAPVGGVVDERGVGLVADGRDGGDVALRDGADDDFLVEAPEIFDGAAAPGDDQDVGTRDGAILAEAVEAFDGGGDFGGGRLALDADRPDDYVGREAIGDAVEDIADDGAGGRGDDADGARQVGQLALALGSEEALGGELAAAVLEQGHEGAGAGRFDLLDDDLVFARAREGGEAARRDDLEAFLRLELQPGEAGLPDDGVERGVLVLKGEIGVAGGVDATEAGDFAAHAHMAELVLDGALNRLGDLGDGELGGVGEWRGH